MNRFRKRLITVILGLICAAPTCCPAQEPRDDEQAVDALERSGARFFDYGPPYGDDNWTHPDITRRKQSVFESEENPHHNILHVDVRSSLPNGEETRFKDADLIHLRGLPDLKRLGLGSTTVTDAGLVHLKGLSHLKSLELWDTKVTHDGLIHLREVPHLTHLNLSKTKVTDAGLIHLAGLTNLQSLSLSGTKVTDAGLIHLKGLDKLLGLNLDSNSVTGAGLANLPSGLMELSLTDCGLRTPSIGHLADLIQLDFCGTDVSDLGMQDVGKLTQLKWLTLTGTLVSDRGAAELRNLVNLERLDLNNTPLAKHGTGFEFLAKMTKMRRLLLWKTGIRDADLVHLKKMKHLEWLDLSFNDICGDGLVHLAELTELKNLSIYGTKLREDTLTHLYGLKNLDSLQLPRRKFSRRAVVALDDALPNVELFPEDYTEDWDREIDRTLLDFSSELGPSRPPRRQITQMRIVMHEIDMSHGLPNRWATRKERFEFKSEDEVILRAMGNSLTGSLWLGLRGGKMGTAYMFCANLGEVRVTTTTDEFVIYITTEGFLLDTTYECSDNRFFNWSAATLIDDILFKQTKKRMPRPLFDHLSGESEEIRRAEEKAAKAIRTRLGISGEDGD